MADPEAAIKKPEEEVEDVEEEIDASEGSENPAEGGGAALSAQLMQNPQLLAALQGKMESMVGLPSGYIENLPKVVKRRIKALKKLQFQIIEVESKFYEEVHELECKYAEKYAPLFEKRKSIINAAIEPTDSDCDWPSDEEDEEEEVEETDKLAEKVKETKITENGDKADESKPKEEENPDGVPEFWLTIFKNVDMLSDMVQDHDEPILKNLQEIKVKFSQANPMGFTLEFFFAPNDHFTNTVLTKEYIMRSEPDKEDPFGFEGPEIIKCKGCAIDWKTGKNITVKVIKKTQKHKGRGTKRTVTKTVQNDSFFNFFSPPEVPQGEEPDEDTESLLAADFEIGHFIRERIVPRAVLYFTGEALEEDDFEDEEGEDEEESDEDDKK